MKDDFFAENSKSQKKYYSWVFTERVTFISKKEKKDKYWSHADFWMAVYVRAILWINEHLCWASELLNMWLVALKPSFYDLCDVGGIKMQTDARDDVKKSQKLND